MIPKANICEFAIPNLLNSSNSTSFSKLANIIKRAIILVKRNGCYVMKKISSKSIELIFEILDVASSTGVYWKSLSSTALALMRNKRTIMKAFKELTSPILQFFGEPFLKKVYRKGKSEGRPPNCYQIQDIYGMQERYHALRKCFLNEVKETEMNDHLLKKLTCGEFEHLTDNADFKKTKITELYPAEKYPLKNRASLVHFLPKNNPLVRCTFYHKEALVRCTFYHNVFQKSQCNTQRLRVFTIMKGSSIKTNLFIKTKGVEPDGSSFAPGGAVEKRGSETSSGKRISFDLALKWFPVCGITEISNPGLVEGIKKGKYKHRGRTVNISEKTVVDVMMLMKEKSKSIKMVNHEKHVLCLIGMALDGKDIYTYKFKE